jgi:hypothetical protein
VRALVVCALVLGTVQPTSRLAAQLQDDCLEGTLWEPYTEVCANVRDVRDQFLPPSAAATGDLLQSMSELDRDRIVTKDQVQSDVDGLPVPGSIAVGTTYRPDQLVALNSGRLHTKMFVHPDGLQPDGDLPVLFTVARNRVHHSPEVAGVYSPNNRMNPGGGQLGLFGWSCLADYPCPDGDTTPGWQWFIALPTLACNITQTVDQGGHAQKLLYYANHTDKRDEGAPPLWKDAVYLWNYCDEAWDLAWEHTYREDKVDCSVPGAGCAWWGPGLEIFGEDPYPQIAELGYEDSLLYHDGVWSELRWPEAGFRDPAIWAPTTPWQLFHLDPNRSYGVGNLIDTNDAPVIGGQEPLAMLEDEDLTISPDSLVINDPDVDPAYHVAYEMTLYSGDNYTHSDQLITPATNFAGPLTVPVTVSDGEADSQPFELQIDVMPVNDAPVITGQNPLETSAGTPFTITVQDLRIDDPDNELADLTIFVQDGVGYQRVDNTITPEPGMVGELRVGVIVSDGELESENFILMVLVTPDVTPPELTLLGSTSVTLIVGDIYRDAGATAVDDVDGDITDRIITNNSVNTSQAGTYTVIYSVSDLAGNSASIIRTVTVNAIAKKRRGGGGADPLLLAFLLLCLQRTVRHSRRSR